MHRPLDSDNFDTHEQYDHRGHDERDFPYRALIAQLVAAAREEVGDIEEMPPAPRARFSFLERSLQKSDLLDAAYRVQVVSFVRLVERCYRAHLGCPVRLAGEMGDVYRAAVRQLDVDGFYPVLRPRQRRPVYLDPPFSTSRQPEPDRRRYQYRTRHEAGVARILALVPPMDLSEFLTHEEAVS